MIPPHLTSSAHKTPLIPMSYSTRLFKARWPPPNPIFMRRPTTYTPEKMIQCAPRGISCLRSSPSYMKHAMP